MLTKSKIASHLVDGFIIATIHDDFQAQKFKGACEDLVLQVKSAKPKGLILDFSSFKVIDFEFIETINELIKMVKILGFAVVCVGLTPGTVTSMIALELQFETKLIARDVDDAMRILK